MFCAFKVIYKSMGLSWHALVVCLTSWHLFWLGRAQLTEEGKNRLLRLHNQMRRWNALGTVTDAMGQPQPPAADMLQLQWDNDLETDASAWANLCIGFHDTRLSSAQGEVLAWSGPKSGEITPEDLLLNLYLEIHPRRATDFFEHDGDPGVLPGSYDKFTTEMIDAGMGHYTQLVWSRTQYVGCALALNCTFAKNGVVMPDFFVCRYRPAGNQLNAPIYAKGSACSRCPPSHPFCNQGLCSIHPPAQPQQQQPIPQPAVERAPEQQQPNVEKIPKVVEPKQLRSLISEPRVSNRREFIEPRTAQVRNPDAWILEGLRSGRRIEQNDVSSRVPEGVSCVDLDERCTRWWLMGACRWNEEYMGRHCARTCNQYRCNGRRPSL